MVSIPAKLLQVRQLRQVGLRLFFRRRVRAGPAASAVGAALLYLVALLLALPGNLAILDVRAALVAAIFLGPSGLSVVLPVELHVNPLMDAALTNALHPPAG